MRTKDSGYEKEDAVPTEKAVETYLSEINKISLLSAEREKELAVRIIEGDRVAREEMIRANLRLVVSIAKKYM